jgi:hypothetical protein
MAKKRKPHSTRQLARQIASGDIDGFFMTLKQMELPDLMKLVSNLEGDRPATKFNAFEFFQSKPRFVSQGFRIRKTSNRTRHRMGGQCQLSAPACGSCGTSLVFFADIDFADKRFSIANLGRLPLLYCCSCPGPVQYQVISGKRINVFPLKREPYEEAPFERPPVSLPRAYLSLTEISEEAESAILTAKGEDRFDSLTKPQRKLIESVLGRRPDSRWDIYFSQIGGYPLSFQDDEGLPDRCPNRDCPNHRRKMDGSRYRKLAVLDLWNDDFWGIKPLDAVQIVFNICPACHSIAAKYTCT